MKLFGLTDRGLVRSKNQDYYLLDGEVPGALGAAVLCDGMGGAQSGEIASSIAAGAFLDCVRAELSEPEPPELADIGREAAAWANLQVYDRAERDVSCHGMGTTLVAAIVRETDAVMVNIGDSRGYWLAGGVIQQVTRDHSHVQDLVELGLISRSEARSHPRRNLITRAVGLDDRIRSDIFRIDLLPGDRLLLCSDGLSNMVTDQEINDALHVGTDLEAGCCGLLELALSRGAPDNVTLVVLER